MDMTYVLTIMIAGVTMLGMTMMGLLIYQIYSGKDS